MREILILPYTNCIISHTSPSARERLEIAKNTYGVGIIARKATGIANISNFSARADPTEHFLESHGNICNCECRL